MKKTSVLLFLVLFLSGCATYKFQKGKPPFDKGYVASRDNNTIIEYTVGKGGSVPSDLELAKERFNRRRETVENYYRKMGYIEDKAKQTFWDPPIMFVKLIGGFFRLPFVAISDYRYEHNTKYREKVIKREEEQYAAERKRINGLKEKLNKYIEADLSKEPPAKEQPVLLAQVAQQEAVAAKTQEELKPQPREELKPQPQEESRPQPKEEITKERPVPVVAGPAPTVIKEKPVERRPETKAQVKPAQPKEEPKPKTSRLLPKAIIFARPTKGPSPLKVNFYGNKSYSVYGRIVSYYWDFGDGDTSTKPNPTNTYISTTYGSKSFIAALTIKDDKGDTATSNMVIEVVNK